MQNHKSEANNKMARGLLLATGGLRRRLFLAVALILVLGLVAEMASASPELSLDKNKYNLVEDFISDLFDDAGDRLKKSKMNGMRQVKQTLRFGRRTDPLFSPFSPEQMPLEELQDSRHLYELGS